MSKNDAVRTRLILCGTILLALTEPAFTQPSVRYDVLIRNGRVLDGSGNPWLAADIGIRGGRIVDMGRLGNAAATRVIDAGGLTITPGFIGLPSHPTTGPARRPKGRRQLNGPRHTTPAVNPGGGGRP